MARRAGVSATRSRRGAVELAGIALAVLLPVPVLALGGLHLPVPETVERGFASLLPHAATGTSELEGPLAVGTPPERDSRSAGDVSGTAGGRSESLTSGGRADRTRAPSTDGVVTPPRAADPDISGSDTPPPGSDDAPRDDAPGPRRDPAPTPEPGLPTAPSGPPADPGAETTTPPQLAVESGNTRASLSTEEDGVTVRAGGEVTGEQGVTVHGTVGESTEVEITPKGLP